MSRLLNNTNSPDDLKRLRTDQISILADEIRDFLIEKVSQTGGHLASNLGVVELTLALHYVFTTPDDKIVWDVGHQTYIHKMLTGRREEFDTLRMFNGISGFPKVAESEHDVFNTGHSSTSISAALGIARARDIKQEEHSVIALIGDGALTGGMAFEALNDAGTAHNNLIVILNDNKMSISENVGGISSYLSKIRTEPFYFKVKEDIGDILNKIPAFGKTAVKAFDLMRDSIKYMVMPGVIFEELGFKYLGPINGHDIQELIDVLKRAKTQKGPVLVHVCTQKGKGYHHAEKNPSTFHGISPFEIETGETISSGGVSFSSVFGKKVLEIARERDDLVAVTAAMPQGTGLFDFSQEYPDRFFDVGIAEQHAVTMSAGLARNNIIPIFAVYSSFLQRSYDQILHDVAMQNLKVIFAIDRAGIVGEDGETHQGVYDLSYLRGIPNMTISAPCDYNELRNILEYAVKSHEGPIAIRYPRGKGEEKLIEMPEIELGKSVCVKQGTDITIEVTGIMLETAIKLSNNLEKNNINVEIIYSRFVKPIDEEMLIKSVKKTGMLVTLEDNSVLGGFGSGVLEVVAKNNIKIATKVFAFPDTPIEHGTRNQLFKKYRLDVESLTQDIIEMFKQYSSGSHNS